MRTVFLKLCPMACGATCVSCGECVGGVEGDFAFVFPVAGGVGPSVGVGLLGSLVDGVSGGEDGFVVAGVPVMRGDEFDTGVEVFVVVPRNEFMHPFAGCGEAVERFSGVARDVFQGGEHCLAERVVVTDTGAFVKTA